MPRNPGLSAAIPSGWTPSRMHARGSGQASGHRPVNGFPPQKGAAQSTSDLCPSVFICGCPELSRPGRRGTQRCEPAPSGGAPVFTNPGPGRHGASQGKPPPRPFASYLLAICRGGASLWSSYFVRILFVFYWCFLRILLLFLLSSSPGTSAASRSLGRAPASCV